MIERFCGVVLILTILTSSCGVSEMPTPGRWSETVADQYDVFPDIPYVTVNGSDIKLDLYKPREGSEPTPVVVYFHGDGWVRGDKNGSSLQLLPYLQMGWAAVNANYRVAKVALAPAAVEDCRCVLRWVFAHAKQYHFNTKKVVVTGHSAGGHLALMVGMTRVSDGFDGECLGPDELRVAAIINWFGVTDVSDLVSGLNRRDFAVEWLGNQVDRTGIATRMSPVTYVSRDPGRELPPILTIHGDVDPTVPYDQAQRFHRALTGVGAANRLVTISGGKHGWFSLRDDLLAYDAIKRFLAERGVMK